ncbi:TDP-N-acetylfucosamine:lipid II N-acetylfucosaminyltransferase [Acinetobacter baumannii]|uniref:TDP-N-acetylfucosamine:lipid II N-acetylfucosaminyltransferase n=1 Tax=Acinetobacter baumannii TaxID=470 RepID=UPI00244CE6BD|nr:TDP-N-acetylfucosamine:lipid II N-acetylfucosaminyltransferase [Acinetobacter baumannii]MDH2479183.1 TDP-N-acetylfucosamine:lipid II N-acetylfucosaminyltransferase [Acinetobacter baumannii]
MSNNILHLCVDDSFTDIALQYFEKASPQNNIVIKFGGNKLKKFKGKCFYINSKDEVLKVIDQLNYSLIVIHALNNIWFDIIEKRAAHIKVVWIGWGYDYYDLFPQQVLLKETKACVNSLILQKNFIQFIYFQTFKPILSIYRNIRKKRIISKIDFFAPVLESEYRLFEKMFNNQKIPKYLDFNYGVLEHDFIKGFENRLVSGNDILLGNSSSATCNHIEAIQILNKINLKNKSVVCPLSYGDLKYQKKISSIGESYLKSSFTPLLQLLPIEEYISMVLSCGNVIMNHVRQQAVGNIILMLYLGAKIYLRKENPIYSFLKENNFTVYLVEDILNDPSILDKKLTIDEIESNRRRLKLFWSEEVIMAKTKTIISLAVK